MYYSCDERDDLRSDIDNLKERVANLEASIEQMNSDISNYQQMVEGKILVVGYSKDEQDNYTIELSNGETVTIYSGKVDMNDMPLFSVNASGHWAYTINDMTTELLVNDKPVSAIPEAGTAGVTPKLKVDANGFWLISIDNGSTWNKLGNNQIADGTQAVANASSLFSNVTIDEATGLARFVITCEIINGDVLRLNRASAQIIVGETTGLRVPIEAIHYLKEDGTESETQGENYIPGVYVKYGNLARFCKIDPVDNDHPLVTDGEYRIVMPSSSDKTKTVSEVRLYDEIIVSGQNLYDGKLL
mgnify:CR=1 FL=1